MQIKESSEGTSAQTVFGEIKPSTLFQQFGMDNKKIII
jgi:hypothetical protein